jgi:hypothetical protein
MKSNAKRKNLHLVYVTKALSSLGKYIKKVEFNRGANEASQFARLEELSIVSGDYFLFHFRAKIFPELK